jgi:cell wall-associated NlpC family hydrolase
MMNESGGYNYTSPNSAGAVGLMQIIPGYFPDLVQKYGDPSDPKAALHIAGTILKRYHDQAISTYGVSDKDAWGIAAEAYFAGWNGRQNQQAFGSPVAEYRQNFDTHRAQIDATMPSVTAPSYGDTTGATPVGKTAIDVANSLLGTPYNMVGNANDPRNGYVDCSGLVQWSFKQAGVNLPRTAQEQYDATQRVTGKLQPGDLVFFTGTYPAGVPVTHVGIYIGDGKMIDAQTAGVSIDDLSEPYWQNHLYGYGRVVS